MRFLAAGAGSRCALTPILRYRARVPLKTKGGRPRAPCPAASREVSGYWGVMYRGQTRTCRLPTKRQPDHVMLTLAQAGLYLGLNVDRVRTLIDRGIINGTRVGRDRKVSMKELRAYKRREEAFMRKLGMTSTMANVMRLAERR